jgi:predicted SAM-dependent methyltransferase
MQLIDKLQKKTFRSINALGQSRQCPLCSWTGFKFMPTGIGKKKGSDALCPSCGSLERHRAAYMLLQQKIGKSHQTLHIAPEPPVEKWLRNISVSYLSIDFANFAMQKMDLTDLKLPDQSQSLVFCSHVLEHIPEDIKAMSEIHRVLKVGGTAIIQVPIWRKTTYEDFSITSKEGRLKAFMQEDHVRLYGLDIVDRLESVGFKVVVEDVNNLPTKTIMNHSLTFKSTNEIFLCTKL